MSAFQPPVAPLSGVRVLNLGGIWAGRVASMLLADQGAEVIEINRPGKLVTLEDALLSRGKTVVELDFKIARDIAHTLELICNAHIVIDNLGAGRAARFGLDYETVKACQPGLVYLSLPGFSISSTERNVPAWEGTIAASMGVFTDLNANAAILGNNPIFTAVPMASAYGGVHGATAATLAYFHYLKTGVGQFVEVPLSDAVLSAMASLAMRIEGQPVQFDLPRIDKVMTEVAFPIFRELAPHLTGEHRAVLDGYLKKFARPQFGHHVCADGRQVFINAADHVHQAKTCLEVLGILDQLIAEGMVVGSPFDEGGEGNNISSSVRLNPFWTARLGKLMGERFLTRPAIEWLTALQQAGVPCSLVNTTDEWLDDRTAQQSGAVSVVNDPLMGLVSQVGRIVSIKGEGVASRPLVARQVSPRKAKWSDSNPQIQAAGFRPQGRNNTSNAAPILSGIKVLDLSNIIAGPAAARTLAEFGAQVTRIDAPAPQAGPRMTMWYGVDVNQGKQALILNLKSERGQQIFAGLVKDADVVVHNFLDKSTTGLGISYEQLRAINPNIICCQVSAWGGSDGGPWRNFPAFDPVLQAATGITSRYGSSQKPALHGIASCVDYITGFTAAMGVAQALVARELGRGGSFVHTSLVMGAQLVQFPFVVKSEGKSRRQEPQGQSATGYGPNYGLYEAADGWVFLACRAKDVDALADALGAQEVSVSAVADQIKNRSFSSLVTLVERFAQASVIRLAPLESLHVSPAMLAAPMTLDLGSPRLSRNARHPSGYPTSLPAPSWFRLSRTPNQSLSPAPAPGHDSRSILANAGLDETQIQELLDAGVTRDGWHVLKHYLPA